MALPRLNESPQYELTIPSSGKKVNYRPFLVKEQKALLIAYESEDQKQIINSIMNCIDACVHDSVDVKKLATFDTDYIFTKIRSKSVGEKTNLLIACEECNHQNECEINLDNVSVTGDVKTNLVKITDDIHIKMKYPSYHEFISNDMIMKDNMTSASIFEMIKTCIDSVMTEEENISLADESEEEVERFVNSLTGKQFEMVRNFVDVIPKITLEHNFTCVNCKHVNNKKLEGLQDFFS